MSINYTSISRFAIEESTLSILRSWIKSYFDGEIHIISGKEKAFPLAIVKAQMAALPSPLDNELNGGKQGAVGIQIIWNRNSKTRRLAMNGSSTGYCSFKKVNLLLLVRAQGDNSSFGGPETRVRIASDLLDLIFNTRQETMALSRVGIHHSRCETPTVIADPQYAMRKVQLNAELQYDS